jgi:hypothetical protein
MCGPSYAAFLRFSTENATGSPEVPRFVSPSRITAIQWYPFQGTMTQYQIVGHANWKFGLFGLPRNALAFEVFSAILGVSSPSR